MIFRNSVSQSSSFDISKFFLWYQCIVLWCYVLRWKCMLVMFSEYIHTGQVKILLDHGGNRNCDLWFASPSSVWTMSHTIYYVYLIMQPHNLCLNGQVFYRVRRFFWKNWKLKPSEKTEWICFQSIIRYCLQVYQQIRLTHKRLINSQPKTQACQLFQASAVLVPVLACVLFDPLSNSSSFKFGFPVLFRKQHWINRY